MSKICCTCKIEKSIESFSLDKAKKNGRRYSCKECDKVRFKKYDASEKGKIRVRKNLWNKQNINITHDEYLEAYKIQSGKCKICNTYYDALCVDHCHITNKVRGLLCKKCNLGIGNLNDNVVLLENAINYLKEYINE